MDNSQRTLFRILIVGAGIAVLEKVMATDCIRDKLVICRYADGSAIGGTNFAWQKEVFGYP
jgi:hypothetical protein